MNNLSIIAFTLVLLSCNQVSSIDNKQEDEVTWKNVTGDLWQSSSGDLGLKTFYGRETGETGEYYITKIDTTPIKEIVDKETFQDLGNYFYKDTNLVYMQYMMAGGGSLWILKGADPITFKALGNCYAKDKNFIYQNREGKVDNIDLNSFKTSETIGCYSKDKNGYYEGVNQVVLEEINNQNIIEDLKKL